MANTFKDYTATAGQTDFAFTFDYLEDEHVKVFVDGVEQALTTNFTIDLTSTKKIVLSNPITPLTGGEIVRVRRISDPGTDLVDFVNGSVLTESELDRAYLHNRYLAEEISELNDASLQKEQAGDNWDADNKRITNVGTPTALADATTKAYVDGVASAISTGVGVSPGFDKFQGNGTQDTFSLSFTTNGVTSAAILVSIDGAVQDPNDYTISGGADEIQFDTPPPNLSEILVIERGYKVKTDIPTEYDWGSVSTDPVSASYSYGQIV